MTRAGFTRTLACALAVCGCVDDRAPGNDREAQRDPPAPPAEVATVGAALAGIAAPLVIPQALTEADLHVVPAGGDRCVFRFTRVGLPAVGYGDIAVLKLNDRLVTLAAAGAGRYEAGGVVVTLRPLEDDASGAAPFTAEFVLQLPGAPGELGYHGYAQCDAGVRTGTGTDA